MTDLFATLASIADPTVGLATSIDHLDFDGPMCEATWINPKRACTNPALWMSECQTCHARHYACPTDRNDAEDGQFACASCNPNKIGHFTWTLIP